MKIIKLDFIVPDDTSLMDVINALKSGLKQMDLKVVPDKIQLKDNLKEALVLIDKIEPKIQPWLKCSSDL